MTQVRAGDTVAGRIARMIRGGRPAPEKRWSATFVLNLVSGSAIVLIILINLVLSHWTLGLTFADVRCLDGTAYWVHKDSPMIESVVRGEKYAYRSKGLEPLLRDGSTVIKIAAALPGDVVKVDATGVYINGAKWGDLNATVLEKTHHSVADVTREFVVPPGRVLMMGNLPRSYDGRYWGPVESSQLIGHAWRLW